MKKITLMILILFVGSWFGGFINFCHQIYSYPQDQTTHTDALVVLTGGRNRITVAGKLYNNNIADSIFISGVNKNVSLEHIEERNKITFTNKEKVYLGQNALDTIGNARESVEWIKSNNINSVRLVTSNYHIPRSLLEFKSRLPDLQIIVYPVYSEKVNKKWWRNWRTFLLIATEYNKYLWVLMREKVNIK